MGNKGGSNVVIVVHLNLCQETTEEDRFLQMERPLEGMLLILIETMLSTLVRLSADSLTAKVNACLTEDGGMSASKVKPMQPLPLAKVWMPLIRNHSSASKPLKVCSCWMVILYFLRCSQVPPQHN